jgi:hypothetical protein
LFDDQSFTYYYYYNTEIAILYFKGRSHQSCTLMESGDYRHNVSCF